MAATAVVATLLFWDVLCSGFERVVGAPETEGWSFVWGWWWMAHSLLDEGRWPLHTTLQGFPDGTVLWLKAPIETLLFVPVTRLLGAGVSHSLGQVFALGLTVVCTAGLARSLGTSRVAAVVGGLAAGFSPHALGELYNGNVEAVASGWLAAWLWSFVAVLRRPSARTVVCNAGALFLLLVGNQYYALAGAMGAPLVALVALGRTHRGAPRRAAAALLAGLAATALGLLAFAPVGGVILDSLASPDAMTDVGQRLPRLPPFVTELSELWDPLQLRPDHRGVVPHFQDLVYPGLAVVLLSLLAPALRPRRAGPWPLTVLALGLFYLVLSLGPILWLDGAPVRTADGIPLALPWFYMVESAPILDHMTLPHRMAVPAALFWGLGTAFALGGLSERVGPRRGPILAGLLGIGILGEALAVPPYAVPLATMPLPRPAHPALVAETAPEQGVLYLPLPDAWAPHCNQLRVYMWWQTLHERPTANLMDGGRLPQAVLGSELVRGPLRAVVPSNRVPPARRKGADPLRELRAEGFSTIVLVPDLLDACASPRPEAWAEATAAGLGPGVVLDTGEVLWPVDGDVEGLAARARARLGASRVLAVTADWQQALPQAPRP